jgi:aromatic ring hydroxylase
MEKDVAQRKVKRQARIIEKLNAAMIQASSLVEIQTIWGNFNMVVNDLKEIDRTQIKRNIHTETVRISEQIFAGEIIIAPSVQDKEEQAALADVHNFLSTANHDQDVEVESMIPTLELVENVEPVLTA